MVYSNVHYKVTITSEGCKQTEDKSSMPGSLPMMRNVGVGQYPDKQESDKESINHLFFVISQSSSEMFHKSTISTDFI